MKKSYIVEAIGTFILAFSIVLSVALNGAIIATPVLAGLALLALVYWFGPLSGAHFNPAITLGMLSVKKISAKEAIPFIVAQMLGGGAALLVGNIFGMHVLGGGAELSLQLILAEAMGAGVLAIGVASVVFEKVKTEMSGIVIGGSLTLGVVFASLMGSAGILNPAVAAALNSLSLVYVLSPILGAVVAFQLYKYLVK